MMDLHIPNALLLVTYLMKLSIGVPPRWIVQAITLVVRATGEIAHNNNNDVTNEATDDANLTNSNSNLLNGNESEYDNARTMLLELDESKRLPGIKVSGTLKLRSRDPLMDNFYEKNDVKEIGCFPNWMASVWSNLFD